jgi:hypothetical protein
MGPSLTAVLAGLALNEMFDHNLAVDFCQFVPKTINHTNMALLSATGIASSVPVLVLAASLLLGACAATDTGKKDDPAFFGSAGGTNGGGGATSGMSFSW